MATTRRGAPPASPRASAPPPRSRIPPRGLRRSLAPALGESWRTATASRLAGARPRRAGVEVYGVSDGPVNRLHKALGYADGINLTEVWDQLSPAKDETYGY